VNVALDNVNQPTKQKALNGLKPIYAGGFRYEPILQNFSNATSNWSSLEFSLLDEIPFPNPASGSQITASLQNSLIINSFRLQNPLQHASTNTLLPILFTTINSPILFNVTRNTPFDGEIRQRVTGSIKVTIKVSPPDTGAPVEFYSEANYQGTRVETLALGNFAAANIPSINGGNVSLHDNIISFKVPAGKTVTVVNSGGGAASTSSIGPSSASAPVKRCVDFPFDSGYQYRPLVACDYGVDAIYIGLLDCEVRFLTSSVQNTYQSSPLLVSLNTGSGTYPLESIDGLTIEAIYPFEGEIVLPQGGGQNGPVDIPLLTLNGVIGNIQHNFTFIKRPTSTNIQFTTAPTYSIASTYPGFPYYNTQAPNTIYISELYDNGFSSGSSTTNNWYFERGNKVVSGSVFTMLTASYDLSKLYYDHYITGSDYYGNYLKQIVPSQSLALGYQDITEYFNPKKGDLIRFYNYDNVKFPFSPVFEREIINIYPPTQFPGTGSNGIGSYNGRLVFEVSELNSTISSNFSSIARSTRPQLFPPDIPAQACTNNPTGSIIGKILNFIMLTKIPDETNVVLIADKKPGQTSPGILLPEFLDEKTKDDAGNIVKRLKAQNLLDINTSNNN
jgi:hypothetical protein